MKKVLIVDDATFIRMSMKTILEKNGYEVIGEAADGKKAIEKYSQLQPDIVLMDITMPDMDGITALSVILENNPQANVVIVSALGQESYVQSALMIGAKGFVTKPYKPETILEALSVL